MKILGIETSCDETGVAVYDSEKNIILGEQLFSQASKHDQYVKKLSLFTTSIKQVVNNVTTKRHIF